MLYLNPTGGMQCLHLRCAGGPHATRATQTFRDTHGVEDGTHKLFVGGHAPKALEDLYARLDRRPAHATSLIRFSMP